MEKIRLAAPSMASTIYIGKDVLEARLPTLTQGQKNFVLTDSNVFALYSDFFKKCFDGAEIFVLPAGEENKNFQSLGEILEKMTRACLHRTAKLFAVGGGVIGDIGGLAASLYMRGIRCVQIPTTLLAQVDSSVGGKTAVDMGGVKNVVGAFYQPCEVLIDPTFLATLPAREIKCGIGEIVKYAALNSGIFDALEQNTNWTDRVFLESLITACVRHKAKVVEADEKESGERKSLNVGHTTGHAIELSSGLSHGESVLFGMKLETMIAKNAGVCNEEYVDRLLAIIDQGIALAPISKYAFENLGVDAEKASSDKKNVGDGKIVMSVAKNKGQWVSLSLPFEEYRAALLNAAKSL